MGKKKNIWPMMGIIILLSIAVIIIILAVIPVYIENPIDMNAKYLTVWHKGDDKSYSASNEKYADIVGKLVQLNKDSSKANVVTAGVQGAYSFDMTVERMTTSNLKSNIYSNSSNTLIVLDYAEERTLSLDGKTEYLYSDNTVKNQQIKYKGVAITISDTKTFTEATIYLISTTDYNTSYYKVSYIAHQSGLYNYITSLFDVENA